LVHYLQFNTITMFQELEEKRRIGTCSTRRPNSYGVCPLPFCLKIEEDSASETWFYRNTDDRQTPPHPTPKKHVPRQMKWFHPLNLVTLLYGHSL
jgi:hypothetical protein